MTDGLSFKERLQLVLPNTNNLLTSRGTTIMNTNSSIEKISSIQARIAKTEAIISTEKRRMVESNAGLTIALAWLRRRSQRFQNQYNDSQIHMKTLERHYQGELRTEQSKVNECQEVLDSVARNAARVALNFNSRLEISSMENQALSKELDTARLHLNESQNKLIHLTEIQKHVSEMEQSFDLLKTENLSLKKEIDVAISGRDEALRFSEILKLENQTLRQAVSSLEDKAENDNSEKGYRDQSYRLKIESLEAQLEDVRQNNEKEMKTLIDRFRQVTEAQHEKLLIKESECENAEEKVKSLRSKVTQLQEQLSKKAEGTDSLSSSQIGSPQQNPSLSVLSPASPAAPTSQLNSARSLVSSNVNAKLKTPSRQYQQINSKVVLPARTSSPTTSSFQKDNYNLESSNQSNGAIRNQAASAMNNHTRSIQYSSGNQSLSVSNNINHNNNNNQYPPAKVKIRSRVSSSFDIPSPSHANEDANKTVTPTLRTPRMPVPSSSSVLNNPLAQHKQYGHQNFVYGASVSPSTLRLGKPMDTGTSRNKSLETSSAPITQLPKNATVLEGLEIQNLQQQPLLMGGTDGDLIARVEERANVLAEKIKQTEHFIESIFNQERVLKGN